jgi:hypothetical protein
MLADESLKKSVETFNQPLQEILGSTGNLIHAARRDASKNDQPKSNDPTHDHRVGDREAEDSPDLYGLLR